MRTRIVETGPSWYPILGVCPCGHGYIRMVSKDGSILFFDCSQESDEAPACGLRYYQTSGGEDGQLLCSSEGSTEKHDFGRIIVEKEARYFESHLAKRGLL